MTNHYDILGLKPAAGHAEIKTAFRRLAKLFHPDKNPQGKEHFERVLKAYEVLSDPVLKASYDYKLNYHMEQAERPAAKSASATKTWSFEEKELKHRQYFNEHYKKNNKSTEQYMAEVDASKSYNEYKYILFATPIAVALFLLIMKLAMPAAPKLPKTENSAPVTAAPPVEQTQLKMGDMPYAAFFGGAAYDPKNGREITIKNETGKELIVCLFTKTKFVRSFYIRENYFVQVAQLPQAPLFIRYFSGKLFQHVASLTEPDVSGAFTKERQFYKSKAPVIKDTPVITLLPGINKQFSEIKEIEFFKKTNTRHDKKN